jgi:uncharacterized phiE125 gp8 family phage protein
MSHLARLTELRERLGIEDSVDDMLLTRLLAAFTAHAEQLCNRQFDRQAAATYRFDGDATEVLLDRFPVESITTLALREAGESTWTTQTDVAYRLNEAAGLLSLVDGPMGTRRDDARVTFAGGYVLPGATVGSGQTALPKDLEHAALEQCAHWYRQRDRLGLSSVSGDGSVSLPPGLHLLPSVEEILKPYRRLVL